jgi:hypothetical protein
MPVVIRQIPPRPRPTFVYEAKPGDPIVVRGMKGMGDNLHQRAIVRQLLELERVVYLETPWPCIYHDLVGSRLKLVRVATTLRTQAKNAQREKDAYLVANAPRKAHEVRVWYTGEDVRRRGSVLAAMLNATGCDLERADFRLPVPEEWFRPVDALIARWKPQLPIMLYRPLVMRTEWGGCAIRNPNHDAYYTILQAIRRRFFVVSVADLVPDVEWVVGRDIMPDVQLHRGELPFESLAALAARSAMVYCSPGFAVLLAQSVGTPVTCVFGGYENSTSFIHGARHAPTLGIDPIIPCACFSHAHPCKKAIDVDIAVRRVIHFANQDYTQARAYVADRERNPADTDRLDQALAPVHEPRRAGDPVRAAGQRAPAHGD